MNISIPMNAARVCHAISRIGYEPHSALMDIIDNSVAAEARNIKVCVKLKDQKTLNQRNNVASYQIADDGWGMDEQNIINAFKLGSDANYSENCLSKYGMGLKAAGLSLGTRIQIVSKKNGIISKKYALDYKLINGNDYFVVCEDLTPEEETRYRDLLGNESGTVVEISGCDEIYHSSAKTTIEKLKRQLGVTYFTFLCENANPRINILLDLPGGLQFNVEPFDILFANDAEDEFSPENYDGAKPCIAFKGEWSLPSIGNTSIPPIKLEVVTFPQDQMKSNASPLNGEQRKKVASYEISKKNKGFFIYRNGRLIRWGDDLEIVGKDDYGFRAKMELLSSHDDILHVDVSKQHLEIDDETRHNLELLMRLPLKQAREMFQICKDLLKKGNGEGIDFDNTSDAVPEDDPIEDTCPPNPDEKKRRAKKKEQESVDSGEARETNEDLPEESMFQKIRYTDALLIENLWQAQKNPIHGTFVLINRRHAFYQSVISKLDPSSGERLALEALIYCCAIGENKTIENLTSVNDEQIRKVFERFYTILSFNLTAWATGNQHLFD